MPKTVLILSGHPMRGSFDCALAMAYAEGARATGTEVRETFVHDLRFDPVLHLAYTAIQPLEPDLLKLQEDVKWAEHLLFAFPIWWGMPPAYVKGMIDRAFHPSWAFKYVNKEDVFQKKLLTGRSARVIATMDSPTLYYRWVMGAPGFRMMRNSLCHFCGISPVRCTAIGSVRFSSPAKRGKWLQQARQLGARDTA